jgi:hypothetical protein
MSPTSQAAQHFGYVALSLSREKRERVVREDASVRSEIQNAQGIACCLMLRR